MRFDELVSLISSTPSVVARTCSLPLIINIVVQDVRNPQSLSQVFECMIVGEEITSWTYSIHRVECDRFF